MRASTLLTFLGAVTLSVSAFAAPPSVTPDAGSTAMVSVQTIQGQHRKYTPADVDGIVGSYKMSDGQTLRVSLEQRKLFAEVGERKTEIVAAGPATFVSRADDLTLVFEQLPFASEVALSRK